MILIIDDDLASMETIYDALKMTIVNNKILHYHQPELVDEIMEKPEEIELIILDIMFAGFSDEMKGGFKRGIEFYLNKNLFSASFPIIIFTNLEENDKRIRDFTENQFNRKKDVFLEKIKTSTEELINVINDKLGIRKKNDPNNRR